MARSIKLMDASIYTVPADDIPKGEKYARQFVAGYTWLAYAAYVEGRKLYKLRPKLLTCKCSGILIPCTVHRTALPQIA